MKLTKAIMKAAGTQWSLTANRARNKKLTPERRSEIATLASSAAHDYLKIAQRTAGIIADRKLGRSAAQIAGKRHVSVDTVYKTLQRNGMRRAK